MNTATPRRLTRPVLGALALAGASAMLLAGCAGGGAGTAPTALDFTKNAENTTTEPVMNALAAGECSAENDALPFEVNSIPQADIDAQIQLLASQGGLPTMFSAGGNPASGAALNDAGVLVDFNEALTDLGVRDKIAPGAVSTIEKLYGGEFTFLPFQYNIEGFWYNKQIFEENGWAVPTTWDELLTVAGEAKAAGLTPFTASGEQGWPITRLISAYLFRELGPDALQKVADGDAKLTDPEYVAAAQQIADLGAQGYFDANVTSLDIDSSYNEFFTGKAAMIYMGSWILGNVNNADTNQIGADNVGFFPVPVVEGGAGTIEQYPSNVGLPATFNKQAYDSSDDVQNWVKCIADNYGNEAIKQGQITGFVSDPEAGADLPPLSAEIADTISTSTDSVLWFEALFTAKASTTSNVNAAPLVTGQMTAQEFMQSVQDALDEG